MSKLPVSCPSCQQNLNVSQLTCLNCATTISGHYPLPSILQLPTEDQEFIYQFILHSGSLKKMALQMEISYPTMRNKLDDIIEKLQPKSS